MIDDSELTTEGQRGVRDLKRRMDVSLRALVEDGIEDGSIAPCSAKMVSFAVAGAINWVGRWYKPAGTMRPEEIAAEFAKILTGGLVPAVR